MFHVLDTAKRYGEIAEEKFQGWDIPGRYLVFGDPKDLKGLMDKELDEVEVVPEEEPKPKKYKDEYIIPGSGFRMLVGDIHNLIVLYHSLARCLSEAETEKDFLRLKKRAVVDKAMIFAVFTTHVRAFFGDRIHHFFAQRLPKHSIRQTALINDGNHRFKPSF